MSKTAISSASGLSSILAAALLVPTVASAQDADGDGAANLADAAPCDAAVVAHAFAPAEDTYGLLLAEDQWPLRGDLDTNDQVVAYNYVFELDAADRVVAITATFDPLAAGGSFKSGLGLVLPVAANAASSIEITRGNAAPVTLTPQTGDAQLTLRLVDDLRTLFGQTSGQINVRTDRARVGGQAMVLRITFATPVVIARQSAPFDLFLFRTDDPTHEVHRPEYAGTSRMNQALFGTADDGSTPSRRYVDSQGLPALLLVPEQTPYPAEGVDVAALFPDIIGFASSGGAQNKDYYSSTVVASQGYRDNAGQPALTPGAPGAPTVDTSCIGQDGSTPLAAGITCKTILDEGGSRGDGIYWLDPDGPTGPRAAVQAWCDMTTDGGGWTVVARASDTNGAGGDYEFAAAVGAVSIIGPGGVVGAADARQHRIGLDQVMPTSGQVDLQYYCYDHRNPASTAFWSKVRGLDPNQLVSALSQSNPDFLWTNQHLENANGDVTTTGNFAMMGRETVGAVRCANGHAGQSGMKWDCTRSGQSTLSPPSVWYLTHYHGYNYTEVSSCGSTAGAVLPYYSGEVRFRESACDNGVQDGFETDIDCGGATCGACADNLACVGASDCASGVCTGGVCQVPSCADGVHNGNEISIDCGGTCTGPCPAASCAALLARAPGTPSGYHPIDPDDVGGRAPVSAYCDMTTDGGGWTVIGRASDTNGAGGDYEFRAAIGQVSIINRGTTAGAPDGDQWVWGLDHALPASATAVDIQYYCYDSRDPANTNYWAVARNLSVASLQAATGVSNPDFVWNAQVQNKDGNTSASGLFSVMGRESTGSARCANGYAGQSGIKFDCSRGGQSVLNPPSVWMLTHYGSYNYTEVTSCGTRAGAVLPYFVGEVRYR